MLEHQKVLDIHKVLHTDKLNTGIPYMVMPKVDGWYAYIDYVNGKWSSIQNEKRVIHSMAWYDRVIKDFFPKLPVGNVRLIGELYIPEAPFRVTNGILNRKREQAEQVVFACHDMVSLDPGTELSTLPNHGRHRLLTSQFKHDIWNFWTIPTLEITPDISRWEYWADKIPDLNHDGIVIKSAYAKYIPGKRNITMMKWKREITLDAWITDVFKTEGKKGNPMWNFSFAGVEDEHKFGGTVAVPKHEDWAKIESGQVNLGDTIEIKVMKILENGSLREPRFCKFRNDR